MVQEKLARGQNMVRNGAGWAIIRTKPPSARSFEQKLWNLMD